MEGMKKGTVSFTYREYNTVEDLSSDDRELVIAARRSSTSAYAPYSKFHVGAAVRLSGGRIVTGANVENAAFPSGICAERNAIAQSVTNYPEEKPIAIAVAANTYDEMTSDYVSPCGMCRQVIAEEELRSGNKIRIILSGSTRILVIESISDLLPLQFNKDSLRTALP